MRIERNPGEGTPCSRAREAGDRWSDMAHSYSKLLYHIVFASKRRSPALLPAMRARLIPYIGGILRERNGALIAGNGVEDHIHLLARLSPRYAVADVVRDVKSNTSRWMRRTFVEATAFEWQAGYGGFTVSQSAAPRVEEYIRNQEEHHRKVS